MFAYDMGTRLLSKYTPTPFEAVDPETIFCESVDKAFAKLADKSMWVFQKDYHAAAALEWAQRHRKKVPDDIAMIALQNNPKYFHLGLSRCEPDWESIGYLMAHAIIGDFPIDKSSKGFLRTTAKIVEKLTTK